MHWAHAAGVPVVGLSFGRLQCARVGVFVRGQHCSRDATGTVGRGAVVIVDNDAITCANVGDVASYLYGSAHTVLSATLQGQRRGTETSRAVRCALGERRPRQRCLKGVS